MPFRDACLRADTHRQACHCERSDVGVRHCEQSEAISVLSLGINCAISISIRDCHVAIAPRNDSGICALGIFTLAITCNSYVTVYIKLRTRFSP